MKKQETRRQKCLIVDDEPLARSLIHSHLEKLSDFEIVAECGDAMSALEEIHSQKIDLMLLDIQKHQIVFQPSRSTVFTGSTETCQH